MRKLTTLERKARAALILAESERTGCGIVAAIKTANARMFGETTRPAPVAETRRASQPRPATETTRPAPARKSKSAKAIRKIVDRKVAEALAARPAPHAPTRQLHEMTEDELGAVGETSLRPADAASPFWKGAPAAPVTESAQAGGRGAVPLHKMSADELMTETAAAYRAVGGVSPYWVQETAPAAPIRESAPPGVQQGPAGATVPTVAVLAIPAPDPATPLHDMSSEDWEAASAAWFAGAARAGHPSPFWQAS
jgi:hypothetical protein